MRDLSPIVRVILRIMSYVDPAGIAIAIVAVGTPTKSKQEHDSRQPHHFPAGMLSALAAATVGAVAVTTAVSLTRRWFQRV
jgi:hypothetical protein